MTHDKSNSGQLRSGKVAVVGLGYVGLPLALLFTNKGFTVTGIDVDPNKIISLQKGLSYLPDITDQEVITAAGTGRWKPIGDYECIRDMDAVIICVPTPLTSYHTPDLSYLQQAAKEIGKLLQKGQTVVLESSTYPGTTNEVLKPILERESGMKAGYDFYIGYSPERIDPGNKQFKVDQIPKVISGLTSKCAEMVQTLYGSAFENVVKVSSLEVAELTKILENAHRLINISFINELAILCDEMKIDVWEAIQAAKTKPFGFTPFYPGPGIGGHCIPVDPIYLQWKAESLGMESSLIRLSDEINRSLPAYIVDRVYSLLNVKKHSSRPNILIYGVAYKKDVNDIRESPALEFINLLLERGAAVSYHDPYIPEIKVNNQTMHSVKLTDHELRQADCVVIITDHSSIPTDRIVALAKLVFDTRNITEGSRAGNVHRFGGGI